MNDCIFCKIIKGEESERTIIFENDTVIAIKPRDEINPGHTLVIPKQHYVDIFDISTESLRELIDISQQLAKSLEEKHKSTGINILHASGKDAGQSVFHFHIHVVPRYADDGLDLWLKRGL
jgi:histidine triad (HIT) family protein